MPGIKEAFVAAMMASSILAMPSMQRRSPADDGNTLEGPVDPSKCPGSGWCGVTSRSAEEQQTKNDNVTVPSVTLLSGKKVNSNNTGLEGGILDSYWEYTYTIYYPKSGSSPDKPGAFAWAQAALNAKKTVELSDINAPPGTETTGLRPVNIVSVHGRETIFAAEVGGSMRAGNALHAECSGEKSNTSGGGVFDPGSWSLTFNLKVLWHHIHTDRDFDVLRDYLIRSGESTTEAVASLGH